MMVSGISPTALIDFHSHYYEQAWSLFSAQQIPGVLQRAWPLLTSIEGQLAAMDTAGIDAKVLTAPAGAILSPGQTLSEELMRQINDRFAALVSLYPQRLLALATVDAFQGEIAAREAERAIRQLGLGGICIDCSQANRFLDAPEARPLFAAAAELDVPVFVHPVNPPGLVERLAPLGHTGVLMARGTENAASLLALLRSGIFDEFPDLKVVFPMIGAALFLFAGIADWEHGREEGWGRELPGVARRHLYVDTMGFDPAAIRFAIELVGAEHVLLGSDWPIMPIVSQQKVEQILASLELTEVQRSAILGGNTHRLLVRPTNV